MIHDAEYKDEPEFIRSARRNYDRGLHKISDGVGTASGFVMSSVEDVKSQVKDLIPK